MGLVAYIRIGGTIVLAFLLYALWRRRKGASYSEIVHFRRHSGTIALSSRGGERLTALPIYRESRYSVRSSKYGSTLSFGKHTKRPPGVPPATAQQFYRQNPWLQDVWKDGEAPTSTFTKHPAAQVASTLTPEVPSPPMVRLHTRHGSKGTAVAGDTDKELPKVGPSISVGPASPTSFDKYPMPTHRTKTLQDGAGRIRKRLQHPDCTHPACNRHSRVCLASGK